MANVDAIEELNPSQLLLQLYTLPSGMLSQPGCTVGVNRIPVKKIVNAINGLDVLLL